MKRLKSCDDLDSYAEKNPGKDLVLSRSSSSHRVFYHKSEAIRKNLSSSSGRYYRDRSGDEDREGLRLVRKRSDYDFEGFDRRKGFDRFRESGESRDYAGSSGGGGGGGGGGDRIAPRRSESYSGSRREYPKGFRSERDRSGREGSVSSWRRFGSWNKEVDEGARSRGGGVGGLEERGSARNSPKGLRDVKSPSLSKDSSSEQSKLRASPSLVSRGVRAQESKSKSPTWSKDSESEQSKSVEVKKEEDLQVESGNNSEMEEGELEPDPDAEPALAPEPELNVEPEPEPQSEIGCEAESFPESEDKLAAIKHLESDNDQGEIKSENQVQDQKDSVVGEAELLDNGMDVTKENEACSDEAGLSESRNVSNNLRSCTKDELDVMADEGDQLEDSVVDERERRNGADEKDSLETSVHLYEKCKESKDIDLEIKTRDFDDADKEVENESSDGVRTKITEALTQNFRDKGKSVAICSSSSHAAYSAEDGAWIDREHGATEIYRDSDMEGPSTRGFELFTRSPVRKVEKLDESGDSRQRDQKLTLEPFDLSLSLPNVLLPIGATGDPVAAPSSPSRGRSVQSLSNTFCTNSDGFTPSMSFSGSHSFFHNPSCSMNQNSMDNFEQSVGSRPIFQGIDQASQGAWVGQSQNESQSKELPLYQNFLMNSNGCIQPSQSSHGISNVQTILGRPACEEESSKVVSGLDRQLSFHKHLVGNSKSNDDIRSSSLRVGSHDGGLAINLEKKRIVKESSGSLYRTGSLKEQEKLLIEAVVARLITEPVDEMSKRFNEMTGQFIEHLRAIIYDIMSDADKRGQLYAIQKALQNKSNITMDMLLKCHRVQLEILVGLKTGLPDFLKDVSAVGSSDLAEIFLNLRCKNMTCRNLLPVDECDCKVCAPKNGFCSACMCLVCSKFDMASNTCSWVGCDVCLHWCHADCALRESYIRNGPSATGDHGATEMQFHCVACDHPSEMFGFVKEVFQNFAKDWTAETFSRELEYVKRIFSASKDVRGKQLHELVDHMLARLANKSKLPEVYTHIMAFISGADFPKLGKTPLQAGKDPSKSSNVVSGSCQEAPWLKSIYSEKVTQMERSANALPSLNYERSDKRVMEPELQLSSHREPLFDELDSIVRIKLAEAKMFQARADDARREAEGLKRIAIAKNKKIDEEYTSRIAKLRLTEADDIRKQKIEELHALERAHREYSSLKVRMEADIRDLLLKMDATKRNLQV
ncbi:protein OBERON 4-like [Cucurbita moschata]|uniref:Protein OBERON 4-like n=1 Tax=Cucurbita moschata TaxID=3662 RepID=A0A6J1GRW6_CUCMO|nr:protein OBERON 4-like [Cucurbita moschata]XP_022954236.1 protein OBERON 4-like [Cucurbita moschata]